MKKIISIFIVGMLAFTGLTAYAEEKTQEPEALWHQDSIELEKANNLIKDVKGSKVKVAIIDSGIDATHPTLKGKVTYQYDAIENKVCPNKAHEECEHNKNLKIGHGTGVASIIASGAYDGEEPSIKGKNIGIASNVELLDIKVLDDSGNGSNSAVLRGIEKAISLGADIINMSLGGSGYDAAQEIYASIGDQFGGLIVIASGNSASNAPTTPNNSKGVISVNATDSQAKPSDFTNYGWKSGISAPGTQIYCASLDGEYQTTKGTSVAAPIVSGCAAWLKSNFGLNTQQLKDVLFTSADKSYIKSIEDQTYYGHGIVNLYEAAKIAQDMQQVSSKNVIKSVRPVIKGGAVMPANYWGYAELLYELGDLKPQDKIRASIYSTKGVCYGQSQWLEIAQLKTNMLMDPKVEAIYFILRHDAQLNRGAVSVMYEYDKLLGESSTLGFYNFIFEVEKDGKIYSEKQPLLIINPIYNASVSPSVMTHGKEKVFKAEFTISPIYKNNIAPKDNYFEIQARDVITKKSYKLADFKWDDSLLDKPIKGVYPIKSEGKDLPEGSYFLTLARYGRQIESIPYMLIDEMIIGDFSLQSSINVSIDCNEGGKLLMSTYSNANILGINYVFTPVTEKGYKLKGIYLEGAAVELKNGKFVVEAPRADIKIIAEFEKESL